MYSFPYLEPVCCSMSSSNCCFLTCIQVSQEAGQVVWYSHLWHTSVGGCDGAQAWRRGATPHSRSGATAERSNPTSKERWLHGCRRAERSYCKFKVRRGGGEEIPLVQVKEQRLQFAGTAVKRYPTSKVRKTKDGRCCEKASEGKHTETIITEN